MKNGWGIIGLGWLGMQLALELESLNIQYWGTHRTSFNYLHDPFPLSECSVLFLNTPPLIGMTPTEYLEKIPYDQYEKIIFISSTSVYGKNTGHLNENVIPLPESPNGKWLFEVENRLLEKFNTQVTIIRPGGLIGGQRHPVYFMSRQQNISGKNLSVNLIHRDDLVKIIIAASLTKSPLILNATAPYHPKKYDYYNQWAAKLGLNTLNFSNTESENETSDRIINSIQLDQIHPTWICPKLDFI
jgi:hypothetical protein